MLTLGTPSRKLHRGATLFTGLSPREHGIIGNSWLEPDGTAVSSVTDKSVRLVGPGATGEASVKATGRSPRRLLARTLGDELITQTEKRAKVFAVSSKDRAAILPGGHLGAAYWIEGSGFVTSSYYSDDVSSWVTSHHESHPLGEYLQAGWPLLLPEESYLRPASASPYAPPELGPSFPHLQNAPANPALALRNSPFGDAAVVDFAMAAIAGEQLGADDTVDILALSLSSTDTIGHYFGPESREMEDQVVRLDRELARLFTYIDEHVGVNNTVLVLSSDHGGCESAEHLQQLGKTGRRLTEARLAEASRASLKRSHGHDRYFLGVESPYVFLNRAAIAADGRELVAVRTALANDIAAVEGVHVAHPLGAQLPQNEVGQLLGEALHTERSGDVYVVPDKHTLFLQDEALAATHGSPWAYDTHVPLLVYIPALAPRVETGRVDVRSVVPTLASLIGVEAPKSAFPALPLGALEPDRKR